MGTSKDISGATTRPWATFKRATTQYVHDGGGDAAARRLISRFVDALGGAAAAVQVSPSGVSTAERIGGLLSGVAEGGVTPTLEELGLGTLANRPRLEVLSGLADFLAGDGSTLEEVAARDAALFLLEEMFGTEGSPEDLAATTLDAAAVAEAFKKFVARYVFNRLRPWLSVRLARLDDPAEQERLDKEVWDYTFAYTNLDLAGVDVLDTDWNGAVGAEIIERIFGQVYSDMENLQ